MNNKSTLYECLAMGNGYELLSRLASQQKTLDLPPKQTTPLWQTSMMPLQFQAGEGGRQNFMAFEIFYEIYFNYEKLK